MAFTTLYKGEVHQNYKLLSQTLGFEKSPFKLKMLIGAITKNVYLAREGLVESVKMLEKINAVSEERADQITAHLLGLINLFHGESIQTTFIYHKVRALYDVNHSSLQSFQTLIEGSTRGLNNACESLRIKMKTSLLL